MACMLNLDFDILDSPWWIPDYVEKRKSTELLKGLKCLDDRLGEASNDEEDLRGFVYFQHLRYLRECIITEGNRNEDFDTIENILSSKGNDRSSIKVRNVWNAIENNFPSEFHPELPIQNFNLSLVKEIHRCIMKDLTESGGEFRKKCAVPAQTNFFYVAPDLVESKLNNLLIECREKFGGDKLELRDAIKYATCFLSQFLKIHPFSNGNGRTARILLSYLLSDFTLVPLSLYTTHDSRDIYLNCITQAQWTDDLGPLARYITECMESEYLNMCFIMDLDCPLTAGG